MYNVGSFLAVFTESFSRLVQPSRADRERQLRGRRRAVRQTLVLTLAPTELDAWAAGVAAVAADVAADAAAVVADAALVGAVSEMPITCSSDSSRLLNRPWVVA
jgi:hypothetical protein